MKQKFVQNEAELRKIWRGEPETEKRKFWNLVRRVGQGFLFGNAMNTLLNAKPNVVSSLIYFLMLKNKFYTTTTLKFYTFANHNWRSRNEVFFG